MKRVIDEMSNDEFRSVFTKEIFNKIDKMIEEKKISLENAICLSKHLGYCKVKKILFILSFEGSSLCKRFEKMMNNKNDKKEGKNEKLLVDLSESYLLMNPLPSPELISISVPCILKAASDKEENEEAKKKVEIALVTLGSIDKWECVGQELYLHEIREIIQYHQEHHNLSRFAYHSAWKFSILRLYRNRELEEVVVNELHFGREAARELDELAKCVDWKGREERWGEDEAKEAYMIWKWVNVIFDYFSMCELLNKEFIVLLSSIVRVFRAARDNYEIISLRCILALKEAENRAVKVDDLLKGGAVNAVLEKMQLQTLNKFETYEFLLFLIEIPIRLKEKKDRTADKAKRKATKKEFLEKMEELGYEDTITSFYGIFRFINMSYYPQISLDVSDYFVNV
eukprot:MONOS_8137.2-p1 / transcript=MONOS_8137.2 / gene=MONOS_8137 / organism=Monocercomonoides_exilis_PA203 / gene_product=unspecified product / transcript_product=unspecified product / location=Mono_scaffold00298:19318-20576(+) / protein_length=399 / sequence_SO=supercontig / SO=protein_coding / is_pseudo=false